MRAILNRKNLFPVIAIAFFLVGSCNSSKKKEAPPIQAEAGLKTSSARSADQAMSTASMGPFTILKLDKQDLIALFQNFNTKKLLIQFSHDGGQFIQAVAFGARKDNVYDNVMKDIVPASTDAWDTTGTKILGNNELTKKQIHTLIGGEIDAANAKDLYFYPKKNANNQIYFIVSTTLIPLTTRGAEIVIDYPSVGEDTKPSPPAPPCSINCE